MLSGLGVDSAAGPTTIKTVSLEDRAQKRVVVGTETWSDFWKRDHWRSSYFIPVLYLYLFGDRRYRSNVPFRGCVSLYRTLLLYVNVIPELFWCKYNNLIDFFFRYCSNHTNITLTYAKKKNVDFRFAFVVVSCSHRTVQQPVSITNPNDIKLCFSASIFFP